MKLELWYPIKPMRITQRFGENMNNFYKELGMLGHNGIDMVGEYGQAVYATHDGVVTFTGEDSSGGLGIVIRTNDKYMLNGNSYYFKTIYWHLKRDSFKVFPGQQVKVGDMIAECDNTGRSTGSHLHFGLKPIYQGEQEWEWYNAFQENGYKGAIDPDEFFNGYFAKDSLYVTETYKLIIKKLKEILDLLKRSVIT